MRLVKIGAVTDDSGNVVIENLKEAVLDSGDVLLMHIKGEVPQASLEKFRKDWKESMESFGVKTYIISSDLELDLVVLKKGVIDENRTIPE